MMENLNDKTLLSIFKNLDSRDLINCAQVCKKWKKIVKPESLFVCYGKKFCQKKIYYNETLVPDEKKYIKPCDIFDNSISFIMTKEFLKNIKTFIYYGNGYFIPSDSFNFYDFSNLKYLEIMDSKFCDLIKSSFKRHIGEKKLNKNLSWNYFSPSIETLVIEYIDFPTLLTNLANVKNILIDKSDKTIFFSKILNEFETTKWQTFSLKKDIGYYRHNYNIDSVIDFFIQKCPYLETVHIFIKEHVHLDKLLSCSKFKNLNLNLITSKIIKPMEFFKKVIIKHKENLKNDCSLCINNFPIKSLTDFELFLQDENFCKPLDLDLEILRDHSSFKINDYSEIKKLKNYQYINYTDLISIGDSFETLDNNFIKIFKYLPETIKKISIISKTKISQELIDLLPKHLPDLEDLSICIFKFGNKDLIDVYNCEFISEFKYLNCLYLSSLEINFIEIIKSIKKLHFLKNISINVRKNKLLLTKFFLNAFQKKELPVISSLRINDKNVIVDNLPKFPKENTKRRKLV